jgi:CDP-4-dehydro-6-deoxyglucose reductase
MKIQTKDQKIIKGSNEQTILEAALSAGCILEHSCKTGQCGVCKTTLLEGEVVELKEQLSLTEADKANNQILTCCCAPKTDIWIDAEELSQLKGIETKTFPARIKDIQRLTEEIIEVSLRLPPTAEFNFLEGQYLDVLHQGLRRSYSIASTHEDKEVTLFIKRYPNGQMSNYWFEQAKANDLLRVEGPKGTFFLRDAQKPIIFLATGTGIAPIKAILSQLEQDKKFVQTHPIHLYWGNRKAEEFVWAPVFEKLEVNFSQVNSQPTPDWSGRVGYVQTCAMEDITNLANHAVYACGSNAMIQSAKTLLVENGLNENQFYSDAFVQSY